MKRLETGDNMYVFGGSSYLYTNSPTATYDFAKMKLGMRVYIPSGDLTQRFFVDDSERGVSEGQDLSTLLGGPGGNLGDGADVAAAKKIDE